nr:MAG TPA: hypothetical protein [Caudoviricetes sp.]DAN01696.1 MAG TPA: hypothetical protein [Caudoviricetes sp.]
MQKIRIDFDNPGLPQHISAVENDSQSRFFQAALYENGKAYTAPEGAAYSIMYRGFGPQNQGWYDTINDGAGKRAACAVSGNVVTCEIARQALQVPGHVSIVLCVTTGKGYMLKSWPIECDCKNDRYDSTAEIQSFFYITQISNESWTQAIQAVEELKNIIDPTLSLSGKAADAAKVGEAVNAEAERAKGVEGQIKEDLGEKLNLDEFADFKNGVVRENIVLNLTKGFRLSKGNSSDFIESENEAFSNGKFIKVPTDKKINIIVKRGYKAYAWCTDVNTLNNANGNFIILTSSWMEDSFTVICRYEYLCISITTVDASKINENNPISAYSVSDSIYYTKEEAAKNVDSKISLYQDGYIKKSIMPVFKLGRVQVEDGIMNVYKGETWTAGYLYSENIKKVNKDVIIEIPKGIKAMILCGDDYASSNGKVSASASYIDGATTVIIKKNEAYPYIILCVYATDGRSIHADSVGIVVYYEDIARGFCANATDGCVTYYGDTKNKENHIVNALAYGDGVIIACRSNGTVVRIGYDGTEKTLLTVTGTNMDWRLCWKDSKENVYVSPHASIGTLDINDRGLYRLEKGAKEFVKVIKLYNPESTVATERDLSGNKDTIWTMCEDENGYLYAGVYAHGERVNPAIYKSTDGGNYWMYQHNFIKDGDLNADNNARHIHCVVYNQYQHALYCIVGEVNTILKSETGGSVWRNLNVKLNVKGTVMLPTQKGIIVGSDGVYNMDIDYLLNDDITHINVFNAWANTVFALRISDITGWIYAFTKIDVAIQDPSIWPPISACSAENETDMWSIINDWKQGVTTSAYNAWIVYYRSICKTYPEDCVRPQHYGIVVSKDNGATWTVCKTWKVTPEKNYGIWCVGQFKNGEILCNRFDENGMNTPIILSEGKHKYVTDGCDFSGDIFIKTNSSNIAQIN